MQPFIDAFQSHQYILLAALIVGAVVALAKQGWLSAWLQSKLSPASLPYFAAFLGCIGLGASEIVAGKTWQQALLDSLGAAVIAVVGHETVIEGLRGGKEIVPARFYAPPTSKADKAVPASADSSKLPPASRFGILTWVGASLTSFFIVSMVMVSACSLFTPKNVTDATTMLSCIIGDAAKKDDIGTIVTDCAGATVQVVEDVISALIAAAEGDGGAPSALVAHYHQLLLTADGGK